MKKIVFFIVFVAATVAAKAQYNQLWIPDTLSGTTFNLTIKDTFYVIWKVNAEWVVRYTGSIDDNGEQPEAANPYVANAVDDLLNKKQVLMPVTESFGCRIFYRNP